ncbi:MAG: PEGA domain-containing protein [Candidatus Magasanikbacteria bacterium]
MYTAGYRWDYKNGELKQTGVLSIDIEPKEAYVFLNDSKIEKKLPIYLPNLTPNSYKIRLTLAGYKTWEKDIEIASKKTTYIKNITLFKDSLPKNVDLPNIKNIDEIYFSADGNYALIQKTTNNIYEIYFINLINGKTELLTRNSSEIKPEITWSPFADFFAIKSQDENSEIIYIYNGNNLNQFKTYSFPKINSFEWSRNDSMPTIFLQSENIIYLLSTSAQKTFVLSDANIWHVDYFDNLWTYNPEQRILSKSKEGKLISSYSVNESINQIIDANEYRLITKIGNNILVMNFNDEQIYEKNNLPVNKIFYNWDTKEWLVWSEWELWSIYNDGSTALLNRTSEKINIVKPMDEHGLLLTASENKLIGFNPGYYVSHDLFANGQIEKLSVNMNERKIFFLGEVASKRGLFELEY